MAFGIVIRALRGVPLEEVSLEELAIRSEMLDIARLAEPLRGQDASLLVPLNFDAHHDTPYNRRATLLWWYFNGRGLVIHGDVVVIGSSSGDGNVPEPLRRNLLEEGCYGIRVRLRDSDWISQDRQFGDYFTALYEALVLQRDWQDLLIDLEVFEVQ